MICELVGVVEWWKMSEDQMYDGGEGDGGDRVDGNVARVRYVMRAILKMMRLWIGSQCNSGSQCY